MNDNWNNKRLTRQIEFLVEVDKLKSVTRRTFLIDKSRNENVAEHSWHISLMALLMKEHADNLDMDLYRVIRMLLLHDLVEIDAGDTFAYDAEGYLDKEERENAAAQRLFGILPDDQRNEWMALWREFEDGITYESRYAAAIDRLHPVIHNYYTGGESWQKNRIFRSQVMKRMAPIETVSETLWTFTLELLQRAVDKGILLDDTGDEED
ncbi:phosphohydrolase [Cohnella kolymensis]|uniref:Phosphohydrolase n=1 Tax=Cohnella kolymensis TaxID=1590652 RepID=A0ABR5A3N8_9BACL|nr:HD domain-containing protein [Cohnella kolymensis]KIL35668.1 phosphohydrolase [Cohnella kolymensis]